MTRKVLSTSILKYISTNLKIPQYVKSYLAAANEEIS
jgi:hypothetical protein